MNSSGICPRCHQSGYKADAVFHYCGDKTKQCKLCGQDWPKNVCPQCLKPGYTKELIRVALVRGITGRHCTGCGRINVKIKLPFRFQNKTKEDQYIIGWCENMPGCLEIQSGQWTDSLTRKETLELLKHLKLCSVDIPGYRTPKPERVMDTPVPIQKIKLPYPYNWCAAGIPEMPELPENWNTLSSDQKIEWDYRLCHIEGWAESPGCLIVRDGSQFWTLNKRDTKILLEKINFQPENIAGYKKGPTQKGFTKDTSVLAANGQDLGALSGRRCEEVTQLEWEQFCRWRDGKQELEEAADEIMSGFKGLVDSISREHPEFDEDFDDLLDNVRRLPRLVRFLRTGEYPALELSDDDLCYYDEDHLLNPSWVGVNAHDRMAKKKMRVQVVIEDISDGKL